MGRVGEEATCYNRLARLNEDPKTRANRVVCCLGQFQSEFHGEFYNINIINFADMTRRENDGVSWDVKKISSL